ncbi:SDR family NAD(P)-dependent oxidoreductase [Brevibacillus sp. NPDC055896]
MTFQETWQPAEWKEVLREQPRTVVCFLSDSHRQLELTEAVNHLSPKTKLVFVSRYEGEALNTWSHSIDKWDSSGFERVLADVNRTEAVEAILFLWPLETVPSAQMTDELTALIQGMHASGLTSIRLLAAAVCSTDIERCHAESWIGFERSIGPLMKDVRMSVHLFTDGFQVERSSGRNLWESLWTELGQDKVRSSLYTRGERHVCSVRETRLQPKATKFRRGGIYLITGGFGGIGMVVAEHLAKTYQAKLILTGRSSIDARKRSMMKKLEAAGAAVFAIQADVCDYAAMKQGLVEARAALSGSINGVIHAAGMESGRSILEKKTEQFHEVIQPKITGTLLLDELLQEERELDFVAYFSSISAVLGDFGSCDYAVSNRFMTAYAERASRVRIGDRRHGGSIVSIQWPLWKDGGMSVGDPVMTKMYLQASGQRALEAEQGIALLELLLAQDEPNHLVMAGNRESVRRSLGLEPATGQEAVKPVKAAPLTSIAKRAEHAESNVEQLLEEDLKAHISRIVAIPIDRIDKEQYFSDFGFNSISFAELASSLTKHYRIDLTPAVFFSYPTVEKLIHFYLREHRDDLIGFYKDRYELRPDDGLDFHQEAAALESVHTEPSKPVEEPVAAVETQSHPFPEPIAIIGMSGRFPEARSVEDMWRILRDGRDVVQPMPEVRSNLMNGESWTCGWVPGVSVRSCLLRNLSARGGADGPKAAAVIAGVDASAGGCRIREQAAAGRKYRRICRS